ncbi:phage antirepressor KilAC domain-containing protein [Staphylococcus pseudintermedius]|nr:phage antirepressor KilAC domain-containing protein [Staphylococcus pseudintermedius]
MRQLEIDIRKGVVTSLEIASETGRKHKNILGSIRKFLKSDWVPDDVKEMVDKAKYIDKKDEPRTYYKFRSGAFILFLSELRGNLELKAKVIEQVNMLENEWKELTGQKEIKETYRISEIAQEIDMQPQALNKFLCCKGIQYKCYDRYFLCDGQDNRLVKDSYYRKSNGYTGSYLVWTNKGRRFILDLIQREFEEITEEELNY